MTVPSRQELTAPQFSQREMAQAAHVLRVITEPQFASRLQDQGITTGKTIEGEPLTFFVDFGRIYDDPDRETTAYQVVGQGETASVFQQQTPDLWTPLTYANQTDIDTLTRYVHVRTNLSEEGLMVASTPLAQRARTIRFDHKPLDDLYHNFSAVRSVREYDFFVDSLKALEKEDLQAQLPPEDLADYNTFQMIAGESARRIGRIHLASREESLFEEYVNQALQESPLQTTDSRKRDYYLAAIKFTQDMFEAAQEAAWN